MGLALREVRKGGRVDEAKNGSGFESASGFREAFTRIFGDPPTAAKSRGCMFAERLDTPLGAMLAVADDQGLRLLEFADRRALEAELAILRQRLKTNVVPGEHRYLDAIRDAARALFFRREPGVRHSAGSYRIGFSTAHVGVAALDSDRRNAVLFLDGGAPRHSECAPRRRPRERHEHALHHHSLSSRHPRRRLALRVRRRSLAEEMAARPRAKMEARPGGLEPPTVGLEIRCSIRLSYERSKDYSAARQRKSSVISRWRRPALRPLRFKRYSYRTARGRAGST